MPNIIIIHVKTAARKNREAAVSSENKSTLCAF